MLPLTSPTANGTWSTSPQEIGTGASSVVRRAVHNPSGQLVAVKQIQILEKAKRDQMVSELRIMRKHKCPWLVTLFNAFYEEATISMVLEFMNGGAPCSSPDAGAAPLPLIRKE